MLTTHLHLAPKLRLSGTTLLLPFYALMALAGTTFLYQDADKTFARPTSICILFDGENISFDVSLVIHSSNIPPIMIINRIYEHQNLLSLWLVSFLVGLRTYQHPCLFV